MELNKFFPLNSSDNLCFLFCLISFFYAPHTAAVSTTWPVLTKNSLLRECLCWPFGFNATGSIKYRRWGKKIDNIAFRSPSTTDRYVYVYNIPLNYTNNVLWRHILLLISSQPWNDIFSVTTTQRTQRTSSDHLHFPPWTPVNYTPPPAQRTMQNGILVVRLSVELHCVLKGTLPG